MGMYATVSAKVECPTCRSTRHHPWQFYFGRVSDLPEYELGDDINWSGADYCGDGETHVDAVGYCAGRMFCEPCNYEDALANVEIRRGKIMAVTFRSIEGYTPEEYRVVTPDPVESP